MGSWWEEAKATSEGNGAMAVKGSGAGENFADAHRGSAMFNSSNMCRFIAMPGYLSYLAPDFDHKKSRVAR